VPGHEVGCLKSGPFRRHVNEIEAATLVQLESEEVRRRAGGTLTKPLAKDQ
jgi:hypothetical protein